MNIKRSTVITIGIAVFLCLLAAFPRAIEVVAGNYLFGYDQGKHWLGAKSIIIDHKLPLIGDEVGGGGGFFQGAGWYWLQAIPFMIWKGDPYGQLFLMFFIGVCSVGTSFILFSKRFGRLAGFCIAFLIALSPVMAIQSRFAWPPFVIPFLTIFFLDALFRVCEKRKYAWFYLFFTIGVMTHFETATAVTLGFATFIFLLLTRSVTLKSFVSGCIGGMIPMLPLLFFDMRHQFLNMRGVYKMFTSVSSSNNPDSLSKIFFNHAHIFSENLLSSFPQLLSRSVFIIAVIGATILFLFDKKEKKELKVFLVGLYAIPGILFIEFLCYKDMLWSWWILELSVFYCVTIGLVLGYLGRKFRIGYVVIVLFFIQLLWFFIPTTIETWKHDYPDYGGTQKIRGRMDAIDAIYKDANGEEFGIFVFCPPIYTYPYDFLFWWVGTKKYSYVPHNEKKGLFYLLIEPDGAKPWTYKGWLETVIKDGTIIQRWELPSGFIIEKRRAQ